MSERQESIKGTWQTAILWLCVFTGPLSCFLDQQTRYFIASYGCNSIGRAMLHIVTILSLALITLTAIYSWKVWNQDSQNLSTSDNAPVSRNRFLAGMALMLDSLSVVLIIALWLPALFYSPCQRNL